MSVPQAPTRTFDGIDFYPLDAVPSLAYRLNSATQTVQITVPPAALSTSVIGGFFGANGEPQPSPPGAFLNYNAYATRTAGATNTNAFTELGLFNRWGVLTSSYLGTDLNASDRTWLRLETTFTQDHPDHTATFRLGDAITDGGMTGLGVRFGGVQYGTNFATRPGLVTIPLPSIQGSAAVPSTLQLYVNGTLRRTQDLPPGPFVLPAVPVASGPGTVTVIVRDLLGREQVITTPFYAANNLLAKGLNDYSFSVGKERENFGVESNDYGPVLGSVLFRRGFTDTFTGEVRAEDSPDEQVIGTGGFFSVAGSGVLNLAVAESHSELGNGSVGQLGYQFIGDIFNGGFNYQVASSQFTQAGYPPGTAAPKTQISGNVGAFLGAAGSASLGYVHFTDPLIGETKLATLNYTKTLGETGFLSLNVFHDLTGVNGNGAFLAFTMPLGSQRSASFGVSHQGGENTPFAQYQKSLPAGPGFGYNVNTQFGPDAVTQGELDYQNNVGTYNIQAYRSAGQTIYAGGISGAVGYLGGDVFASRQLTDAFAVVDVPGQADVDVYAQNQVVARTNDNGYAVIPHLLPYERNVVGFDARNLPLDSVFTTTTLDLVPYYRSGLVAKFDVTTVHGVTFAVKLPDGSSLPAGALIAAPNQPAPFPVGYNGQAYVTGITGRVRLKATWAGHACEFTVDVPTQSPDPLPDLGIFTCEVPTP